MKTGLSCAGYIWLCSHACAISIHFRQDQEYQESLQKDQQRSSLSAARRRSAQELPKEATAPRKATAGTGNGGDPWVIGLITQQMDANML